ncbi:alginate O-acetyltransferase AlgX-related protein [Microbulbifer sp. TRSA007]|uniref:alginate O-acetyltransferase AlgX-related protein n=1 Tax=Microbulbifer sp. TRSA007 TaxID=3243384 RepID=UPI0040395432
MNENTMVYSSGNGWLFLTGGSNNVLDIFSGEYDDSTWVNSWANILEKRADMFTAMGVDYCHIAAPEKISIYHRYLSDEMRNLVQLQNSPAFRVEAAIREKDRQFYIDPAIYLRRQSENYLIYHKTDTHWNFLGAYSAYQLLMNRLGYKIDPSIPLNTNPKGNCIMDLGGKFSPPIKEKVFFYTPRKCVKRVFRNELVKYKEENLKENEPGLHVGSIVGFKNDNAIHGKRVLIFGDSFSEYRPQLLTGLLAETFTEVKFVWGLNIDNRVVDEYQPDIVITESAERFMPYTVPSDNIDYDKMVFEILNK